MVRRCCLCIAFVYSNALWYNLKTSDKSLRIVTIRLQNAYNSSGEKERDSLMRQKTSNPFQSQNKEYGRKCPLYTAGRKSNKSESIND